MRIVVTGANGFLGSALIRKLTKTDHEIVGVTRQPGTDHYIVSSYAEAPVGDILVHLAEDSDRVRVNSSGSAAEAEMCTTIGSLLSKGYKKTIYASSAILYGDSHLTARQVGHPIEVVDPYTRIKFNSEAAVLRADGTVARIANLYGPCMAKSNVMNKILNQVPGTGELVVYDSSPVRDFIWVDDAAAALMTLITSSVRGIFNVGTGIGTSIHGVAVSALVWAGQEARAIGSSHPSSRLSHLVVDITETTTLTGWKPAMMLHQGIGHMFETMNNRRA